MSAQLNNVTALPAADPLVKWTTRLADGLPINWSEAARELSPALLESLRQVAALAGSFALASAEPTVPGQLNIGAQVGDLRIDGVLGAGGYGTVYRAHDLRLDRDVALKIFKGGERQELLREGQLMAKIDHPNVLKVFGAVEHQNLLGFVTELMPNESLDAWFAKQQRLSGKELVAIGEELCAALCALHQGNIVHGDLKPANVLRHASGRWVVADFGSSQFAHDPLGCSGTPLYMAPERFVSVAATPPSDQYSLGVLLFYLASKRYPFEAETVADLKQRQQAGQRQRLLDLRPDLPRSLIQAIEKALAFDPKQRHPSCGHFAAALGDGEVRRSPRWLLATAAGLGAVALASLFWTRPAVVAETDTHWMRVVEGIEEPLRIGDTARVGDALALRLALADRRYVYVLNEDSAGARYLLFPLADSDLRNPLGAGAWRLPGRLDGADLNWRITSRGGRERFYVLISDEALPDTLLSSAQAALDAPIEGLYAYEPTRGVGGLAPTAPPVDSAWLADLKRQHPSLEVREFELSNP